ncbi:hypothetical protein OF83DRAFT_1063986 [Amylostereum chailletii]|nr:hypothetical protein OF83DRAFT_1063986 [Amylostereum chailletii]
MATQEEPATFPGSSSLNAHEIRITSGGKINFWVDFALKFFAENAERPLALHTLPAPPKEPTKAREVKKISPSTTAIPKLVSVVEIIKREYLKSPTAEGGLVGLFQYNELGCLEAVAGDVAEGADAPGGAGDRAKMLVAALEGTKNVRIQRTPYMKVTLCRKELPSLAPAATAQRPEKRKMSKSARGRLKKKMKKSTEATQANGEGAGEGQGETKGKGKGKGLEKEKDK